MAMTNVPLNEKNMAVLNSILEDGFIFIDENDQPKNINQVISFLLNVVDIQGYLKIKTSEILDKYLRKENEAGL
jgi:hypothetical protein